MSCCKKGCYAFKVSEEAKDYRKDETKYKHVWGGFKEQTTAHGIPHVDQAQGPCKKVFWFLISLGCLVMLGLHLYYISLYFSSWPVNVLIQLQNVRELDYPAVTICNVAPVKASKLYLSPELEAAVNTSSNDTAADEARAYEVYAGLNVSLRRELGFTLDEMVLSCQYAGSTCTTSDFVPMDDPTYGNCYVFNSGWDGTTIEESKRSGRRYGLKMTMNIHQEEYIRTLSQGAGLRLVIHPQFAMPFPADDGILAPPGQVTSVGIRQIEVNRLGGRFGECADTQKNNITRNVFEEFYPVNYTNKACFNTCYQRNLISQCGCGDSLYPTHGTAFGRTTPAPICDETNSTQDTCVDKVSEEYLADTLDCDCLLQCDERSYSFEVSNVAWPAQSQEEGIKTKYAAQIQVILKSSDVSEAIKENLLQLEVYFQEFNFEKMSEASAYLVESFASDFGGILGLWLGLSLLSIFEFFELIIDVMVLCCYRTCGRSRDKNGNFSRDSTIVLTDKLNAQRMDSQEDASPSPPRYDDNFHKPNFRPPASTYWDADMNSYPYINARKTYQNGKAVVKSSDIQGSY